MMENRLSEIWRIAEEKRMKLGNDPMTFFEQVVGFKPTAYQERARSKKIARLYSPPDGSKMQAKKRACADDPYNEKVINLAVNLFLLGEL